MNGRETGLPAGAWPVLHDLARWVGSWLFRPMYRLYLYNIGNVPADGPVVLVANHSAFVDGPLLYGLVGRRVVFLVKHEMFRGVVGRCLVRIGQLAIRRGEPDRAPLLAAQAVLRAGGMVAVFPEGTRGVGDAASARGGAAWLARSTGAVVLPVVCRGTRRPDGSGRRFRPRVDVLVGEPFQVTAERGRAGLTAATEQVRVALADLITELDELRDGHAAREA
ncbi:lysophospholipid acyltransferase family protein [Pseudonocardia acaciae]|uniref:lysophospholipid acyltransferase family protein n=1 Tax=Pseudonocardia acaciae TaxID=551276 RepID=UPI00048BE801|nr:lysophospholipid acyltransferase family protein [Pseudonocardia acaciae]